MEKKENVWKLPVERKEETPTGMRLSQMSQKGDISELGLQARQQGNANPPKEVVCPIESISDATISYGNGGSSMAIGRMRTRGSDSVQQTGACPHYTDLYDRKEQMPQKGDTSASGQEVFQEGFLLANVPMMQGDFNQPVALNDPDEIKKQHAHIRALERDVHKSMLKREEIIFRENHKSKKIEISERNQEVWFQEIDRNGYITKKGAIFHCKLEEVRHYVRETGEEQFQLVISIKGAGCVFSPLYEIALLKSTAKLRQTILDEYVCAEGQSIRKGAWEWIQKKATMLCHQSKTVRLPAFPGWYDMEGKYLFWARNRGDEMLRNKEVEYFELRYMEDRRVDGERIQKIIGNGNIGEVGALLLIRLIALLGRVCSEEPIASGVVLYGDTALEVAKRLLSVSIARNNIINLDTDRINVMRSKVSKTRDDAVIFAVTNPENKSTQNRIRDVISWFGSGYIEGDKVTVPYIFCVKKLSQSTPNENCILINAELISVYDWEYLFDVLQSCWVDVIEQSGSFIVEQLKKILKQQNTKETGDLVGLSRCIASVTSSHICYEEPKVLQQILEAGVRAIESQSQSEQDYIVDIFHSTIEDMADKGYLRFCSYIRDAVYKTDVIYYDDQYYYFTSAVMTSFCNAIHGSNKILLSLKQQLVVSDYLKVYRQAGKSRELQVDITLRNEENIQRHVSVVAVKSGFWDEIGGVCLWERGETVDA